MGGISIIYNRKKNQQKYVSIKNSLRTQKIFKKLLTWHKNDVKLSINQI